MASSHKKVIVRLHTTEAIGGYLSVAALGGSESIEVLDLSGKVLSFPLGDIKWVCFVRDFNSGEIDNPERLLKKTFGGRPRNAGVWLRLRLGDGEVIEGLASNDVGLVTGTGLFMVPPDIRSNTQRMFLPRTSIKEFEVVMVIAPPGLRKPSIQDTEKHPQRLVQDSLFP